MLLTACTSSTSESIQTSGSDSAVDAPRTGREIFASNCAACHGAAGEGHPDWRIRNADGTLHPPPLNGDGHTWHHADGLLYRIVSQGGKSLEVPGDHKLQERYAGVWRPAQPRRDNRSACIREEPLGGQDRTSGLSIRETQEQISERDPFPSDAGEE